MLSEKGGIEILRSHLAGSIKIRTYASREKGLPSMQPFAYNFF